MHERPHFRFSFGMHHFRCQLLCARVQVNRLHNSPWISLSVLLSIVEWVHKKLLILFFPFLSCTTVFCLYHLALWLSFVLALLPRSGSIHLSPPNFDYCLPFAFCSTLINCWQLINYRNSCFCFRFSALVGWSGMISRWLILNFIH